MRLPQQVGDLLPHKLPSYIRLLRFVQADSGLVLQLPCAKEQVVELNVGGHCFTTLRSTLSKHEDSMLCKMFSGDLAPSHQDSQGRYFIDRDGTQFGNVLAYLRGEPLQMPSSFTERSALAAEASFYQV